MFDELLHGQVLTTVDIPRDRDKGLNRGFQDEGLWQWLCRYRTRCVRMRREVLYRGWVHREWSLAHEVRWRGTREYNSWLVFEHWQLVWKADGYGARGRSRKNVGWIVTLLTGVLPYRHR